MARARNETIKIFIIIIITSLRNLQSEFFKLMNKLILDANAFIKEIDFNVLAEKYEFYTLPGVVSEVRDERAR